MRREFALGVGESFIFEHSCGSKHTVINIEGIETDAGEVEMLLQTWQNNTLLNSQRVTLSTCNLGSFTDLLETNGNNEDHQVECEAETLGGFHWRR